MSRNLVGLREESVFCGIEWKTPSEGVKRRGSKGDRVDVARSVPLPYPSRYRLFCFLGEREVVYAVDVTNTYVQNTKLFILHHLGHIRWNVFNSHAGHSDGANEISSQVGRCKS
jgi:hypothetical protein